jgi:hypothetical protein
MADTRHDVVTDWDVTPTLKPYGRTCQCSGCSLYFTGVTPFDRHFMGIGKRCRTPEEMLAIGMTANKHGVWATGTSKRQHDAENEE